ncbi:hypothetical protein [Streptomyces poonensis]|uniref:Uncharacterized protein n=1 Tax=Streptomyces poonensis TaxID=68255 RepID=A0A918UNM7_9ACTN|nr:hypothetical protein [Streptomyces poonensis]GGZ24687.1 hypothetical protein GCM10010365_51280 [Streptomyces poonensis]GLJ90014.1 hypothetical protein GCM10017589_26150 [Streptomyces poonensis]
MDKRSDPVEIIARVGGVTPYSDHERAFGTWVCLASKAGWQVAEAGDFTADSDRGEIGAVDVEGVRYVIRLGPRVRRLLYEVVDGHMVKRDVLAAAAWAEPVVTKESAPGRYSAEAD